ncbi:MAG: SoxR reducing system RseC family protein [Candidatus Hydrogenedentota bacterium]|nr:MAG: SoxR reducing system RseC family protein [Candidatus Hydrogenedentota bacterium]
MLRLLDWGGFARADDRARGLDMVNRMEGEIGKVIEAGAGSARVEVSQSGICARCEIASSCVPGSGGSRIIEVADPLGVSVNQRVRVELSAGKLIGASFVAYILPLLGLFAGAVLGFYGSRSDSKELWGGVGVAAGLAAGLLGSRLLGQYFGRRGRLTPTITAIVAIKERGEGENAE